MNHSFSYEGIIWNIITQWLIMKNDHIFISFFWPCPWKFQGQGSNLCHSSDPKLLQWQWRILNSLHHKRTSPFFHSWFITITTPVQPDTFQILYIHPGIVTEASQFWFSLSIYFPCLSPTVLPLVSGQGRERREVKIWAGVLSNLRWQLYSLCTSVFSPVQWI